MKRFAIIAPLLCFAGCATAEQQAQYERDQAEWVKSNQVTSDAWSSATGGEFSAGTGAPPPTRPSWFSFGR